MQGTAASPDPQAKFRSHSMTGCNVRVAIAFEYISDMPVNFSGAWLADLAKSTFTGPRPAVVRLTIEHRDPELRQELIVTKCDGTEDRAVFICQTTGEEGWSLLNGSAVRGCARWTDHELTIETWMKFGERELYFCDCWSLSPDKQTLVMEHRKDALAGQKMVLERIAPDRSLEDTVTEPR